MAEERGPKALIASSAKMPPPDPFVGTSEHGDRRAGSLGSYDPALLAACYRGAAFANLPVPNDIATITTPTLVLAWSGDPRHPVSTAERLRDTLPNVQVSVASTRADYASWSDQLHRFLAI